MLRIITDSTCYLPPEFISKHKISVVPLKVQVGSETYHETGLSQYAFYQQLITANTFPTTSQPAVTEFKNAYQEIFSRNATAKILVLSVSSKLSGTYNSAFTAALQLPQADITVFDSRSAAMGLGLMVMAAAQMAADNRGISEIMARLEQMRQEIAIVLYVDTLEYLKRGGRIGAAAAFVGTLLDAKPILALVDGQVQPLGRVRTKKKPSNVCLPSLNKNWFSPNNWFRPA
ncbi:MAG: DegV family protein [Anaerolineae bacterium]|nr:DegV family protein [Anaerolineae bacterium]